MSHVPVISSAPIPFKPEHSNCRLAAEMGMVVVLPRSNPFTWNPTTTSLVLELDCDHKERLIVIQI